jgi:glyoxylase-like metal-dependent hydrolase (beta-lactamase superfamily II)
MRSRLKNLMCGKWLRSGWPAPTQEGKTMWKKLIFVLVIVCVFMPRLSDGQEAKAVLADVAKAMGDVKSLQYTANGSVFTVGQNLSPGIPWVRYNAKSYTRTINYDTVSMREELVRTQGEQPPRGAVFVIGEQRQIQAVSGTHAWNQAGETITPRPYDVADRQYHIWITPHGVIKAAAAHNATVQTRTEGGKRLTTIAFVVPGKLKVNALVNERNLIEKVDSWDTNPVVGDMLTETTYADYKDFGGAQFPTKITQKQGGFPTLDLTVSEVKPNAPADIQVPDNVRQASGRVETDKVAEGVWYLTGGSHHSVLVEMQDHLVVIEGPQNDARATEVIAEVKKIVPNKPIKYVVNSHHHFDHSGGLAAFVAEGATVITHDVNKAFFEQSLTAPRTVQPDKLAQSGKKATVEGMQDKRVLSDGTRTVELYHIQGTIHDDGIIMAYLPKEKLLVEADVYTPAAPNTAPPAQPNPLHVNLYDNIERLKLTVDQLLPLHGRKVPLAELQKWIGKTS